MIATRNEPRGALFTKPGTIAALGAFFAANLLFLVGFADRDGYEGDDLNSILPMAHLAAAKQGLLLIYRYAWQPLSYEIGARLWQAFGTPTAIFLSAPIAGAIALTGLLALAWGEVPRRGGIWLALLALLAVPEFWFSSLYYNSTIVGLPCAVGAILLLRWRGGLASAALAGVAIGLAILTRLDFILTCPLLAMIAWSRSRTLARPVVLAGAVVLMLAAGWAIGLIDPRAIIALQAETAAEIHAKAHMPGWDTAFKLRVASITLSPLGWLLLIGGLPAIAIDAVRNRRWTALLWLIAALPACYPLLTILSPKYALPLAIFLPILFVHCALAISDWLKPARRQAGLILLGAIALVPVFISASLFGHAPFVVPGLMPERTVGTHDGRRGHGGYLWLMIATDGPAAQMPAQTAARQLRDAFRAEPSLVVAGSENYFDRGAIAWRHLQLLLEREGVHGSLVAPHQLRFTSDVHSLLMVDTPPQPLPAHARLIDLRDPAAKGGSPEDM